jgi:hypothetical protein
MTRRGFLRDLLATLATGLGIALVPTAAASAIGPNNAVCCPSNSCPGCPAPKRPFWCRCPDGDWCLCLYTARCYSTPC